MQYHIDGGNVLSGVIHVSGSKNSSIPIIAATILTDSIVNISNLPIVTDIENILAGTICVGKNVSIKSDYKTQIGHIGNRVMISPGTGSQSSNLKGSYGLEKTRAGVLFLGPLLAKFGNAAVSMPSGCRIGDRKIDLHLDILTQMGAHIFEEDNALIAKVSGHLKACNYNFRQVSVGATETALMAATLAQGVTTLTNIATEPEIIALINFLTAIGAKISLDADLRTATIFGVERLNGCNFTIPSDRIEAATWIILSAINQVLHNQIVDIIGCDISEISNFIPLFEQCGINLTYDSTLKTIKVKVSNGLKAFNIKTEPYPGMATDIQPQLMLLACFTNGISTIQETVFENRFQHVPYLNQMGANITIHNNIATIHPIKSLVASTTHGTDLRAAAALVMAGIFASGGSTVTGIDFMDRGYEIADAKLTKLGAKIRRVKL